MADTWLTEYGRAWDAALGRGSAPYKQLAKVMKPLEEHYTPDDLCARLTAYLADAGKYASPSRFAATVGLWEGKAAASEPRGDPGPITDEWGVLTSYGDLITKP